MRMRNGKRLLAAGVAAMGLLGTGAAPVLAQGKTFAIVPKAVGVAFYADVETGCNKEAAKIGARCLFTGPPQLDDAAQVSILQDLVTQGVAGIAVAPNNAESIKHAIALAVRAHIPIITFDSDSAGSKRIAFVGTNNRDAGATAGAAFVKAMPHGGRYAIITGGLSAANLNERIEGFRSKLNGSFHEVSGSPFSCNDDSNQGVQILQDILTKNPDLDGVFISGGWPLFAPEAYQRAIGGRLADLKAGKFTVVSFDAVPAELQLLKNGDVSALVGQRPYAMGVDSIDQLNTLSKGGMVPKVTDTGVDLITASNVDQFMHPPQ